MERLRVDLADLQVFLRVVETGSLSRAAERLNLSKSIVSRRLSNLETCLAARLITRGARGAQPTELGQAYYARAANILAGLEAANEMVATSVADIAGKLRITAPLSFGIRRLTGVFAAFAAAHPRVELDISFEDKPADLITGGYDLAVRIGNPTDSSLVARRVGSVERYLVGSPAYLAMHGRPIQPRDLSRHQALLYVNEGKAERWRFRQGESWEYVAMHTRLRSDNGEMLRDAAINGLGLAKLPDFIVDEAVLSGALEVLLPDYPLEGAGIFTMMPPGRAVTARVRGLIEFLIGPEGQKSLAGG
ncbi:MAG: LysR family transcriptional regulator [Rhodospirillales bacterium]|nr:LysR family transcriptional regulator [Rhodospirillales bacterium]